MLGETTKNTTTCSGVSYFISAYDVFVKEFILFFYTSYQVKKIGKKRPYFCPYSALPPVSRQTWGDVNLKLGCPNFYRFLFFYRFVLGKSKSKYPVC